MTVSYDSFESILNDLFSEQNICKHPYLKNHRKNSEKRFLSLFKEFVQNQSELTRRETCEKIFCAYLVSSAPKVNEETFFKLFKMVVLYIEALNFYNWKPDNDRLFCEINSAEDAPDISNEFILDFLKHDDDNFGFSFKESKEMVMHFCAWLFEENFSCSKLFEYEDEVEMCDFDLDNQDNPSNSSLLIK